MSLREAGRAREATDGIRGTDSVGRLESGRVDVRRNQNRPKESEGFKGVPGEDKGPIKVQRG